MIPEAPEKEVAVLVIGSDREEENAPICPPPNPGTSLVDFWELFALPQNLLIICRNYYSFGIIASCRLLTIELPLLLL